MERPSVKECVQVLAAMNVERVYGKDVPSLRCSMDNEGFCTSLAIVECLDQLMKNPQVDNPQLTLSLEIFHRQIMEIMKVLGVRQQWLDNLQTLKN